MSYTSDTDMRHKACAVSRYPYSHNTKQKDYLESVDNKIII